MAVNPSLGGEPALPYAPDGQAAYTTEPGRQPVLDAGEELRLARAAQAGDRRAAIRLVEANLRLVVAIARRYASGGRPFLDLVQEGAVGLLRAVDGFDPARGCRLSTYASRCIVRAVRQAAAEQGRLIRVPPATAQAVDRLRLAAGRLVGALGRDPSAGELAEELGTTAERVTRLVRLSRRALPLDGLGPGQLSGTPADEVVLVALRIDLYAMLAGLTARERRLLRLRFGLVDGRRCSLEEIGRRLGLSRERIRQIEKRALARLCHAADAPGLAGHLD